MKMTLNIVPDINQIFGSMRDARRVYGISKSSLYRLAATHPELLRKMGRSTIVDLKLLREVIALMPQAEIRGQH